VDDAKLWIGLVRVKPLPGNDWWGSGAGAYTNIITWAESSAEFRQKAQTLAAKLSLYVVDVEGEEPLSHRSKDGVVEMTEDIEEMITRAKSNPNAIVYGTFHKYPFDDA
jgi:hypothetical protein